MTKLIVEEMCQKVHCSMCEILKLILNHKIDKTETLCLGKDIFLIIQREEKVDKSFMLIK